MVSRLHFRRDVFPLRWHPEKDRPAARLVFAQVCSSVKNGENQTSSVSCLILVTKPVTQVLLRVRT